MDQETISETLQVRVPAKEVYVLMNDKCSVSRNARVTWYLKYLNNVLPCHQNADDEFEILSAIPADNVDARQAVGTPQFVLEPTTVDAVPCGIIYDQVFLTLSDTLRVLVRPVLLHGCVLSESNLEEVLKSLQQQIALIETKIADTIKAIVPGYEDKYCDMSDSLSGIFDTSFEGNESFYSLDASSVHMTADVHFLMMLRYGFLALQLLKDINSMTGVVLITDGAVGLPDSRLLDVMLQQMRHDAIACSSVQLEMASQGQYAFGLVPHPELLKFIAMATSGTYFPRKPRLAETGDSLMNSVHRGLLMQTFYRALNVGPGLLLTSDLFQELLAENQTFLPLDEHIWSVPMIQKKHLERVLHVPIGVVIACRLREGYFIRHTRVVTTSKGEVQIQVRMMLPWRDNVKINYIALAPWPISQNRQITQVEVITETTFNFFDTSIMLSLVSSKGVPNGALSHDGSRRKSSYREAVLVNCLQAINLTVQTDERLEHVQSFNMNPLNCTPPDSLHHGVPLLILSDRIRAEPIINPQLVARDVQDFAKFWKPVMCWEVANWQKWFHVNRISLILEHDTPSNKHVHIPNSSGRYNSVTCRQAMEMLTDLMRRNSSFTLAEKHSYVTLLYGVEPEKIPFSFYLLRVVSKPPCLMLKLAFLCGTSGELRKQVLNQLKADIIGLRFPQRGVPKQPPGDVIGVRKHLLPPAVAGPVDGVVTMRRRSSIDKTWSDRPCCIITRNPLSKMLIRYGMVPQNFSMMNCGAMSDNNNSMMMPSPSPSNLIVGDGNGPAIRLRLNEGFHFAYSETGIHNLVVEVNVNGKNTSETDNLNALLIQYIIFPPSKVTLGDVLSEETGSTSEEVVHSEGESNIAAVTEMWIEPHHGIITNCSQPLSLLDGLQYMSVPDVFFSVDAQCMSTLVTFERLVQLCQNATKLTRTQTAMDKSDCQIPTVSGCDSKLSIKCEQLDDVSPTDVVNSYVTNVTLSLDLMSVLSRSRVIRLLFSSLKSDEIHGENGARVTNNVLLQLVGDQLKNCHDIEYSLSDNESAELLRMLYERKGSTNQYPESDRAVKWRCYIRLLSVNHVVVSVEPLTYDDLLSVAHVLPETLDSSNSRNGNPESNRCSECSTDGSRLSAAEPDHDSHSPFVNEPKMPAPEAGGDASEDSDKTADNVNFYQTENEFSTKDASMEVPPKTSSLLLPVFVFDCKLDVITNHLTSPWIEQQHADVTQDLTFQTESSADSVKSDDKPANMDFSYRRLSTRMSFTSEMGAGRSRRISERSFGRGGGIEGTSKRCSSSDFLQGEDDLQRHCSLVSETFLRCFVIGIYRCLLSGWWVDSGDVEEAVNSICEELTPVETDITNFIISSCRLTHPMLDVSSLLKLIKPPADETSSPSVTPSIVAPDECVDDSGSKADGAKPVSKVLLSAVTSTHQCELTAGLHQLINTKFMSVVEQFFKPVASNKDFYFFSPTASAIRRNTGSSSFTVEDDVAPTSAMASEQRTVDADGSNVFDGPRLSYVRGSASSSGSSDTSAIQSCPSEPLFVMLMCSVRIGSWTNQSCNMASIPVRTLPVCFGELHDCLPRGIKADDIDLNSVQATLDIICLTLPPAEIDLKQSTGRPCLNRWTSFTSQPDTDQTNDMPSPIKETQTDIFKERAISNPLQRLPTHQTLAIQACRDQIEWMLRDEIVSSLRQIHPVSVDTLSIVCDHIRSSRGRQMFPLCRQCQLGETPLQFVYGSPQSLPLFEKHLEGAHIAQRYRFCKVEDYYYLYRHRCSHSYDDQPTPLSSTVIRNFSGSSNTQSPASMTRSEISPICEAITMLSGKGVGTVASPMTVIEKPDSVDVEQSPQPCKPLQLLQEFSPSTNDVQIHVQRPSPIREAPKNVSSLPSNETGTVSQTPPVTAGGGDGETAVKRSLEYSGATADVSVASISSTHAATEASASPKLIEYSRTSVDLAPVEELASSPESTGSNRTAAREGSRSKDTSSADRVRPISGPAAVDSSSPSKLESVRKSHSVTDNLDEPPRGSLPSRGGGVLAGHVRKGNMARVSDSTATAVQELRSSPLTTLNKRVHSVVSFDGQQHKSPAGFSDSESQVSDVSRVQSRQASSSSIPVNQPLYSELRLRHASGLDTPMSYLETNSIASTGEAGYEGDWSDPEDESGQLIGDSFGHRSVHAVPDFWLVVQLKYDKAIVYFQTRDVNCQSYRYVKDIYPDVNRTIKSLCHIVNQKLLLDDLYRNKRCKQLLVPEEDDDVHWGQDSTNQRGRITNNSDSSESDDDIPREKYLAATIQFKPGHFSCHMVRQYHFVLHPRLQRNAAVTTPRPGLSSNSPGMQALLTVLDKFGVSNRRNMFVIKENKSGNVFYIRLSEKIQETKTDNEELILSASQNPSTLSMALKRISRTEDPMLVASSIAAERAVDKTSTPALHGINAARRGSVSGISLSGVSQKTKIEERITLSVHGIRSVGEEIDRDLLQMLQKKLDDAVLDNLLVQLTRNQMHKLTAEDVQFIQKPSSSPECCFQLLVPSIAVLHQSALGHYLRQNLQQLMFAPKYLDGTRAENMFQDFTAPDGPRVVPDGDVFLYRPQVTGSKGIACVCLAFVDGKGYPVHLLPSPRPPPERYKEPLTMFDSILNVQEYKGPSAVSNKSPGPTSLIQFKIWRCGSVDTKQLCEALEQAIRHSVCDIILEYWLLTAPICEVPPHYCKGMLSPMHSAPTSPNNFKSNGGMELRNVQTVSGIADHPFLGAIKTPKETSSSMQGLLFDNLNSPASTSDERFTTTTTEPVKSCEDTYSGRKGLLLYQERLELMQKISQYESGERGHLNQLFNGILREWLDRCYDIGVPAVSRSQYQLSSRPPVDSLLRETQQLLTAQLGTDLKVALFRSKDTVGSVGNGSELYLRYAPRRQPSGTGQTKDSGNDYIDYGKVVPTGFPGRGYSYIMIGRNIDQWRSSLDVSDLESCLPATPSKNIARSQKFQAMDSGYSTGSIMSSEVTPSSAVPPGSAGPLGGVFTTGSMTSLNNIDQSEKYFVPRQKLFLMFINDKKVTVYMYNWTGDQTDKLETYMSRLVRWHNARTHVAHCIAVQKLGLFHHVALCEAPAESLQERNQFAQSDNDLESLIRTHTPSAQTLTTRQATRARSGTVPPSRMSATMLQPLGLQTPLPPFDRLYRDARPCVPMHRSHTSSAHIRDVVHRHGFQALELRVSQKKISERRQKLEHIYTTWQQRTGSSHPEITEDILELLKKSSRTIHVVMTPFLFSPAWRHEALCKLDNRRKRDSQASGDSKQRSRHSSGTSMRSKRSDSIESAVAVGTAGGSAVKNLSSTSLTELLQRQLRNEDPWHMALRGDYMALYMQYLQQPGAGFHKVQVVPTAALEQPLSRSLNLDRGAVKQASAPSTVKGAPNDLVCYMQKTLPGGILLIELSFREIFYYAKVFAFESMHVSNAKRINSQLILQFNDECDKVKDICHVHSFAYDFYLRTVQSFVSGSSARLGSQYHLTSFLHDFVTHFATVPVFARNCVHEDQISIQSIGTTGQQLFDYMRSNDRKYNLSTIYMAPCPFTDTDLLEKEQFALMFPPQIRTTASVAHNFPVLERTVSENYEVSTVITMNCCKASSAAAGEAKSNADSDTLNLRFWVIMTNQQEVFPRLTLESKHSVQSSSVNSRKQSVSSGFHEDFRFSLDELQTTLSAEKLRKSSASNAGNRAMANALLENEVKRAKEDIVNMVNNMKILCRRDLLWNRLIFTGSTDEPDTRRRRRTDEEFRDPLPRLSFDEFQSLLDLVPRMDICDFDPNLRELLCLPVSLFQSLVQIIVTRYPDTHRLFTAADGSVQYVVIINKSYVDALTLIRVSTVSNTCEVSVVFHDHDMPRKLKEGSLEIPADVILQNIESFVNLCCYHIWTSLASTASS